MSSRLNPRHYFTRSQGSQSSDAEDPSRQVSGETYQGDFATMDPAMQRESVSSMGADGRRLSESLQGMRQGKEAGKQAGSGMMRKGSRLMDVSDVPEEVNTI